MHSVARLAIVAGIAVYAAALAVMLQPGVLVDDAAITFRYVERFTAGLGLTYNDHEHVLGLSNPLYALLLAAGGPANVSAETMARTLAIVLSAVVAVQSALLAERFAGSGIGLLAGVLLPLDDAFRGLMLGGMESGLATCLGLGMVQAISKGRDLQAAVLLGLAIWNKLDAALLAIAFAAATVAIHRTLPVRTALISALVVAPWWIVAWWYYGSPLPQSLSAKLVHAETSPLDPFWVVTFFRDHHRELLLPISLVAFAGWRTWSPTLRLAAATLGLWFLAHATTFSLLNLGAPYPWYLTVLIPPPLIFATAAVAIALATPRRAWQLAGGIAAIVMLIPVLGWARDTAYVLRHGNPVRVGEAFEGDRRLAGVFLRLYSDPAEVVESAFGWVAAEIANPFNDSTSLNSVAMRGPVKYYVHHGVPFDRGAQPPVAPAGFVPLATFNMGSSVMPGFSWFVVYGAPDSRIATSRQRSMQLRLFELDGAPVLNGAGLSSIDLKASTPSDASFTVRAGDQRAMLVFSPTVDPGVKAGEVTVSVWSDGHRLYEQPIDAAVAAVPVAVRLPSPPAGATTFSLRASSPSPIADRRVLWKDVRVVIGDSPIDINRLGDRRLLAEWLRQNPHPIDSSVVP